MKLRVDGIQVLANPNSVDPEENTRTQLNLIGGSGVTIVGTDKTIHGPNYEFEVTVSASGGGGDHATEHEVGGGDELTGLLNANARVLVRRNGGANVGPRRRINFLDSGGSITATPADDAGGEEIDVTLALNISAINVPFTDGDTIRYVTVTDARVGAFSRIVGCIARQTSIDPLDDEGFVYAWTMTRLAAGAFDVLIRCVGDEVDGIPNETVQFQYLIAA